MLVNKDALLDALLKAIDTKIDAEKGERGAAGANSPEWHYADGRVDGVDAARYIVEQVISEFAGIAGAMSIGQAKSISGDVTRVAMAYMGIDSAPEDVVSRVKGYELDVMVQASKMMDGYRELQPDGSSVCFIKCDVSVVADTYLRLHKGHTTLSDVIQLCEQVSDDQGAEYGVLIDGHNNITLLELNDAGNGGESVVYKTDYPMFERGVMEFINNNS